MARLVEFNGRRIVVPDDATDDEIRGILTDSAPAAPTSGEIERPNPMVSQAPAPSTTPDPTAGLPWDKKIAHALAAGSQAGLRGMADYAGIPVDLLAAGSNLLNFGLNKAVEGGAAASNKMFGTDFHPSFVNGPAHDLGTLFNKGLDTVGLPPQDSASGTIANIFSEGATELGAPPLTHEQMAPWENTLYDPVRFAMSAGSAGKALSDQVPGLVERMAGPTPKSQFGDFLVRQYAANPAKTITGDVVAGAGAGAGHDIAEKNFPNNPWVDALAMLAGGTGGAQVSQIGGAIKHGGEAVIDKVKGTPPNIPAREGTLQKFTNSQIEQTAGELQSRAVNLPKAITDLEAHSKELLKPTYYDEAGTLRDGPMPARPDQMPTSARLSRDPGLVAAEEATRRTPEQGPKFIARDDNTKGAAAERLNAVRNPNANFDAVGKGVEDRQQSLLDAREAEAIPLLRQAEASGATVDAAPVVAVIDRVLATAKRPAVRTALTEARKSLNVIKSDPNAADVLDTSVSGLYETRKHVNDIIAGRGETPTGKYAQSELIAVRDALDDAINKSAPEFGQYLTKFKEGSVPLDDLKASVGVTKLFDGQDPIDVATEILGNKHINIRRSQEIKAAVAGNEEATTAWKAAVAEALYKRVTGTNKVPGIGHGGPDMGELTVVSQAKLAKEFDNNIDVLTSAFTPEEMSILRQGHKFLEAAKAAEKHATTGSQTTPSLLDTKMGKAFQLAARHFQGNLEAGGTFKTVRIAEQMLPWATRNRQAIDELTTAAWFDPGLMAQLLGMKLKNRSGAPYNVNLKRIFAGLQANEDTVRQEEKQ